MNSRFYESDKCDYIKNILNHEVIVCLYVDDVIIMSKDTDDINATKCMLSNKFDIKESRVAGLNLGVRVLKTPQGRTLF